MCACEFVSLYGTANCGQCVKFSKITTVFDLSPPPVSCYTGLTDIWLLYGPLGNVVIQ